MIAVCARNHEQYVYYCGIYGWDKRRYVYAASMKKLERSVWEGHVRVGLYWQHPDWRRFRGYFIRRRVPEFKPQITEK